MEVRLVNYMSALFSMYLSVSVALAKSKLKTVSLSSSGLVISGKNFSTEIGMKKLTHSISKTIENISFTLKMFIGAKGYGWGMTFTSPIRSLKNKIIGYESFNVVIEVTKIALAIVTVSSLIMTLYLNPATIVYFTSLLTKLKIITSTTSMVAYASILFSFGKKIANTIR